MNKLIVDLADRVGSTAVQGFAGSMTAITATGTLGSLADWRYAAVSAGSAALFALVKVLGVQAASQTSAVVQNGGTVSIDEAVLVKALGDKLSGK